MLGDSVPFFLSYFIAVSLNPGVIRKTLRLVLVELEFGTILRSALSKGIEPFNAGQQFILFPFSLLFYCRLCQSCTILEISIQF